MSFDDRLVVYLFALFVAGIMIYMYWSQIIRAPMLQERRRGYWSTTR